MQYLSINDYDYFLPEDKIAKYPLNKRDSSKLLVFNNGKCYNDIFANINKYIPANSLLVYNDTKVIQARLIFRKSTGAKIEIFLLEPDQPADFYSVFQQKGSCTWKCIVGNLKKWKDNSLKLSFSMDGEYISFEAFLEKANSEECLISFSWLPAHISFGNIIEHIGKIPIPPYLRRESEEIDLSRYQTVYSLNQGSVAAPTAGLHFTPSVIEKLRKKNIICNNITLHIGAGTFLPVKEENALLHKMHTEYFCVTKETLRYLLKYNGNITAVGTTTLRTLESIYLIGIKLLKNDHLPDFIDQWDAYDNTDQRSTETVLKTLIEYCEKNNISKIEARTRLMIIPGNNTKMAQRLFTNFHQPKSTLLLLVATFIGKNNWKKIYNYALNNNYRFLSYGDSCLLIQSK